ncbi:MAG: IS1 family transposase [Dissulfurispiraceae bacterium]
MTPKVERGVNEICPRCNGRALYKNGKTWVGKQRFLCIMCGKQFTSNPQRVTLKGKPLCPKCGRHMNLYRLDGDVIRFRCSCYPQCKTFRKYTMKEEND